MKLRVFFSEKKKETYFDGADLFVVFSTVDL